MMPFEWHQKEECDAGTTLDQLPLCTLLKLMLLLFLKPQSLGNVWGILFSYLKGSK